MTKSSRMRCSIPALPLEIQPDEAQVRGFSAPGRGESVVELRQTAAARGLGLRNFEVTVDGWLFEVTVEPAAQAELRERVARTAGEHQAAGGTILRAQIPGRVVRVWVEPGEAVEQDQRLLAIEAMKMENEIRAPHAGVIKEIKVELGGLVERHDELISFD